MHRNTKYWSLTWEPNKAQKKIPGELELVQFLNIISTDAIFQYEKGKIHIQGVFTLEGPRHSKKQTLELSVLER